MKNTTYTPAQLSSAIRTVEYNGYGPKPEIEMTMNEAHSILSKAVENGHVHVSSYTQAEWTEAGVVWYNEHKTEATAKGYSREDLINEVVELRYRAYTDAESVVRDLEKQLESAKRNRDKEKQYYEETKAQLIG